MTTDAGSDAGRDAIRIDGAVLAQLAYHIGHAAGLAADGRTDDCVPHAVLAWALLEAIGGGRLTAETSSDLPDELVHLRGASGEPVRSRAVDLALQLCAHFTSEGQHRLAQLYQDGYGVLQASA